MNQSMIAGTAESADARCLDQPNKQRVLERIIDAHEEWYDIERNYVFEGYTFPGFAAFHSSLSQFVLVKRAKLWEANSHEYLFFVDEDFLTIDRFESWFNFMKTSGMKKVELGENHMSSYVSLVIVANQLEEGLSSVVKKARYRKNFMAGLKGWADVRVAVVDLHARAVYTNAQGKPLAETLSANAFGGDEVTSASQCKQAS
jgi:hypothetical protein